MTLQLNKITYRLATSEDIPEMALSRFSDPDAGTPDPRMALYLDGKHHPQHALLPRAAYVASDGDTIVAYIAGHLTRRYACDGEIQYLFVAPAYRRQGIASELVRLQARWFAEQHARRVCVNAAQDNLAARQLYLRLGASFLARHWLVWNDIVRLVRT